MKNKKAEKVIERLQKNFEKENKVFTIQMLGDKVNKLNGFSILMYADSWSATEKEIYHGIKQSTLDLLNEAEIEYKLL